MTQALLRRSYQLEILSLTSQQINAVLEPGVIMRTLISAATKITGATGGAAGTMVNGNLILTEHNTAGSFSPMHYIFSPGQGVPGWVVQTRLPYLTNDAACDPHISSAIREELDLHNLLGVPLLGRRGELVGYFETYNKPEPFDADDIRILQGLAASASIALENAQILQERERAEDVLREREAQLAGIIETAMDAIITFDADQNITRFNRAAEEVFGWSAAQVVGKSIDVLVPVQFRDGHRHMVSVFGDSKSTQRSNRNLGVLQALRANGEEFPAEISISTVDLAGQQLYTAILRDVTERQRAERELREREQHLRTLHTITQTALEAVTLEQMLQAISDRLCDMLHADSCYIALWDAQKYTPIPAAGSGTLGARFMNFQFRPGDPTLAAAVLDAGRAIAVEDIFASKHISAHTAANLPAQSLIGLPLTANGEKLGVAYLAYDERHSFAPDEISRAEQVAGQIALAVAKARSFTQAQDRLARLATLHEIELALTTVTGLSERLNTLLEHTQAMLKTDIADVLLLEPSTGQLVEHAALGISDNGHSGQALLLAGQGAVGWIAQHGVALAISDVRNDERWVPLDDSPTEQITSFMGAPLRLKDQIIGVLAVATHARREFSHEEQEFIATLASQASGAIEHARLLDETRSRLTDLEAINQISSALRVAQSLEEMLPQVLDKTLALLGTGVGMIAFVNPQTGELKPVAARGWFGQMPISLRASAGMGQRVLHSGASYVTRDFKSDPATGDAVRPFIPPGWNGAMVPIRSSEQIIGVLGVALPSPLELASHQLHMLTTIAEISGTAIQRTRLHESLEDAYLQTVLALANAMDARDTYTAGHSERLAGLAVAVARELGVTPEEEEPLQFAASLHDIGKIGVPDAILRKPGPLDDQEWQVMKQHPVIGADIILPVKRLQKAVPIVRHHQEKFNGTGYPDGLSGESIPLGARILAVVDAYGAITDNRVYRSSRPHSEALKEIRRCAGSHFDPRIVHVFLRVARKGNLANG